MTPEHFTNLIVGIAEKCINDAVASGMTPKDAILLFLETLQDPEFERLFLKYGLTPKAVETFVKSIGDLAVNVEGESK